MALDKILNLAISYPDFKLNQIIDPEQFDLNNKQLVDKINQIVGAINSLTQPGGAGNIGITPLPEFPETTDLEGVLRCILDYAIENRTQLGALDDEIDVLFRDVYATITTIQGKNKEQDDKLAGLKVVDEINDARVGIVEGRVKTVEERATDLEVRIDGLEETNANVEITSARTSGINGQTYQTIGKRIDDLEIGHDKIIPTGKRGRFNFVITDEESTKTWEDSVKQVALDTHEKDPSAHNLLFAGHELDETSHQDIRDEVERVGVNAGAEVSETQPTSGSKVWIESVGQNDLTNPDDISATKGYVDTSIQNALSNLAPQSMIKSIQRGVVTTIRTSTSTVVTFDTPIDTTKSSISLYGVYCSRNNVDGFNSDFYISEITNTNFTISVINKMDAGLDGKISWQVIEFI